MIKRLIRASDPRLEQWRDALQLRNDPTIAIDRAKLTATIAGVLHTLTPREQRVLTLRYGLDGEQPLNRDEIAATFQVTRERIKQIEMKASRKLCQRVRANQLEPFKSLCAEMARCTLPTWPDRQNRKRAYIPRPRPEPAVRIGYGEVYTDSSSLPALQAMIADLDKCSVIAIEQRDKQGLRSTLCGLDIALKVLRFKSRLHPVILLGWQTDVAYMDDHRYQKIVAQYRNVRLLRLPVNRTEISVAVQNIRYWC
jgi:hypothetical protein